MELDSFSVDNFIQRLPQDIINSIIPYTYQPQSETLLKDIRNYSKTINLIRNLYYQYWTVYKGYSEIDTFKPAMEFCLSELQSVNSANDFSEVENVLKTSPDHVLKQLFLATFNSFESSDYIEGLHHQFLGNQESRIFNGQLRTCICKILDERSPGFYALGISKKNK